jgi:hypothetical protein
MEDIMELRAKFLHQEVKIVDGSPEDGEFGYVVGVTAHSAEPITVLFYHMGEVKHQNYYRAVDLALTGDDWKEGKPRDSAVRCRKSRFDALWRIIDSKGPHGVGSGTQGGAWSQYLAEVRQTSEKEKNEANTGSEATNEVASEEAKIDDVVGAGSGRLISDSLGLDQGNVLADTSQCQETGETDRPELGGTDRVGEARAD